MKTKLIAVIAIASALGAAPAIAQQTGTGAMTEQQMQQYVGWPVYSQDDQQIGTVASVQQDKLRVNLEQAMGMGAKTVEVEKDQFKAGENRINLSMGQEEAKQLPEATQ